LKFNHSSVPVFFLLFAFLIHPPLFGQLYHIQNYSKDEGLPQLQVFSIEQDTYGFIWFGTAYGLTRYDGNEFIVYGLDSGLPDVEIISLCKGDSGQIWVGTALGLCRIDQYNISKPELYDEIFLPQERIIFLFFDTTADQLWVTTKSGSIFIIKEGHLRQVHKAVAPLNCIFKGEHGNIWISGAEGMFVFNPDGKFLTYYQLDLDTYPVGALVHGLNEILILTTRTLYQYNYQKHKLIQHPINKRINSGGGFTIIEMTHDSTLWIGGTNGAWKIDETVTHITRENGLAGNLIRSLMEDREGNIWAGTYTAGVSKIVSTGLIGFGQRSGLDFSVCSCVIQSPTQGVLAGTDRGIKHFINYRSTDPDWAASLRQKDIWVLRQDHQGNIWAGIAYGLYRFKPAGNGYQLDKIFLKDRTIFNLFEDSQQRMWIACDGHLFYYYQGIFEEIKFLHNYALGNVWTVDETYDGMIWIGTATGLVSYNGKNTRLYTEDDGLTVRGVNVVYEDSQKNLWIGTDLGLLLYQDEKFAIASDMENFSGTVITDIAEDKDGVLWIGTERGLTFYDGKKVIKRFGKINGLIGDEFTTDNSILFDDSGKVWLGVFGGISILNQRAARNETVYPSVFITHATASKNQEDFQPLAITLGQEIPFDLKIITFRYAGLSFTNEEAVMYRTFLEGFDTGWSEWNQKNESRYTNLYPGSYTLHVACMNSYGLISPNPTTFSFHVAAPFWLSKIFIIVAVILLIMIIYFIILYKTKSIQRRNRLLEEKVAERTRELSAAKEYVENIIEYFGDMVMTVNKDHKIITWNNAARRIFGYAKRDVIGKKISFLDKDSDDNKFSDIIREFEQKGVIHEMEIHKRASNKEKKELLVSVNHLKNPFGTVDGYTFVVSDVSEKKRLYKELLNREKLLGSIEALQKLLGTLSHHINNSVTAMYGMAQLSAQDTKFSKKLVHTTQEQTKRIRAVLQSLSKLVAEMNLKTVNYAGGNEQIYDIGTEIDNFLKQLNETN
jgi:PAS domain S-box-containing protein